LKVAKGPDIRCTSIICIYWRLNINDLHFIVYINESSSGLSTNSSVSSFSVLGGAHNITTAIIGLYLSIYFIFGVFLITVVENI